MPSDYNLEKMSTKTREKVNRVASELLDGKSKPEALEAAGYSSKSNNGPIRAAKQTLAWHLDAQGLTDEVLAERIEKFTNAKQQIYNI